jgi:hypothetical protein
MAILRHPEIRLTRFTCKCLSTTAIAILQQQKAVQFPFNQHQGALAAGRMRAFCGRLPLAEQTVCQLLKWQRARQTLLIAADFAARAISARWLPLILLSVLLTIFKCQEG